MVTNIESIWNAVLQYANSNGVTVLIQGKAAEFDPASNIIYMPKRHSHTVPGLVMLIHELGHIGQTLPPFPINTLKGQKAAIIWYEHNAWDNGWNLIVEYQIQDLLYIPYSIDRLNCMHSYMDYIYKKASTKQIRSLFEGYTALITRFTNK
jgi:hypothetical protein